MSFINAIINVVFPKRCFTCKAPSYLICPHCLLGCPRPFEQIHPWVLSVFRYRHPTIQKAVWMLKYHHSHAIAKDLAPSMYDELLLFLEENLVEDRELVLVPIPLSRQRQKERGFNQSEALASSIASLNKDLFVFDGDVLKKIRDTVPQAKIKEKTRRQKNLGGAFICRKPKAVQSKTVIIVDDVTTTGTTIAEARKVLKQAGAKRIFALTLAH